jgi:cyclic-di-AMP phosphodiesterase PgpH
VADSLRAKKRRRKVDQYLRGAREDPEGELLEMTNLSNNMFRLVVGLLFSAVVVLLIWPFRYPAEWQAGVGVSVLILLVNTLGWLFIARLYRRNLDRPANFNQLIFLVLLTMLLSKCIFALEQPPFIAPLPMLAMVMSLTLGQEVAFVLVIGVGFYLGFASPDRTYSGFHFDLVLATSLTLGGVVSVLGMARVRQQSRPVVVGARAGIVQALVVIAWKLIHGKDGTGQMYLTSDFDSLKIRDFLMEPAWALIGGLISGAAVTCFLPAIERVFGIITERRLLALTDPNYELLSALRNCAPGTYTHTLRVADLASDAAEAIGADPLLARVGAYYHDIGKIAKPEYFVENKESNQNIHDRLRPSMSKLVIISHVKEGIELAEEEGLPQKIIDMIPMHHGTTVVEYFYHKAKTEGDSAKAEVEYRYPGPKPHFREAGILMLADGVEASAKSIAEPNPNRFRAMVHELILRRLTDHQLDDSDLTMRDLTGIEDSFVHTLTYMYHGRIKYPGEEARPPGTPPAGTATPAPRPGETTHEARNHHRQPAEVASPQSGAPAKDPVGNP